MAAVTGARNQSSDAWSPVSDRNLGWWGFLPPLVADDSTWWLPLSDTALVALSLAMTTASPSGQEPSDRLGLRRLEQALQQDPPLLIHALFRWSGGQVAPLSQLAASLADSLLTDFAGGDWLLAAPAISPTHQRRWSRLMAQCRSRPVSQWAATAGQWLSVTGPEVDAPRLADLPKVIWDADANPLPAGPGSTLLERLARMRQHEWTTASKLSELAETRKLEAAKQLAYGLSHEINNPLANVSARAQQLQREEPDPRRRESLEQIVQQVYRAHEMIAGLMFYAHPPQADPRPIDLNELVGEVAEEFRPQADALDIRLLDEPWSEAAMAPADRLMIMEALRVLVRNSIEAIGRGGTIVVSVRPGAEVSEPELGDDARWLIHVADSGPGLTPEASQHAFDPFYSGREAGRGLGLGLCRAYRVAQLHGATIRLTGGLAGCVATIALPTPKRCQVP